MPACEYFVDFKMKFIAMLDSISIFSSTTANIDAMSWKYKNNQKRLLLSSHNWLLLISILLLHNVPLTCTTNLTSSSSSSTYHASMLLPTTGIVNAMRESKLMSVSEGTKKDTTINNNNADYLDDEEDSAESYDDTLHVNYSGKCGRIFFSRVPSK
jgi:hypothetical protein